MLRNYNILHSKSELEEILKNPKMVRVIYPDDIEWCLSNHVVRIGYKFQSIYWGTTVEITEISGDGKTVWVEEV